MAKNIYEKSIDALNALNALQEALDGYGAFAENPKLCDMIDEIDDVLSSVRSYNEAVKDLTDYKLKYAQKWFEELGYTTQIANGTIELFVSNGKGDDGYWIGISKNDIEMAVDDYQQLINERAADEYMDFMKANDLNPSKETELEYAKYLLKENRRNDALDYVDDEEELQTLETEISNSKMKSRKM